MTGSDTSFGREPDHHPPHFYLDETWYIITASTLHRAPLLAGERSKKLVGDTLKGLVLQFEILLRAWVILDNHYHLLLKTGQGKDLPRFIGRLHGSTARQINLWNQVAGRQVWHNYWDTCIRTEAGYWTNFNYIHNNPVKHGYVRKWEDWPFSSYGYYVRTKGDAWLMDCWERYPVVDFLAGDDFDSD